MFTVITNCHVGFNILELFVSDEHFRRSCVDDGSNAESDVRTDN